MMVMPSIDKECIASIWALSTLIGKASGGPKIVGFWFLAEAPACGIRRLHHPYAKHMNRGSKHPTLKVSGSRNQTLNCFGDQGH